MTRIATVPLVLLIAAASPFAAHAQLAPVPIRPLGRTVAVSKELLANIGGIRALSDGRVVVNDKVAHRVVLFDSSLTSFRTVADTTSETAKAYSTRPGGLLSYYGDSSLFADQVSLAMLVIDPNGKINRVIAAPRGNNGQGGLAYTASPTYGTAFDGRGGVVSRWSLPTQRPELAAMMGGKGGAPSTAMPNAPLTDSAVILRANILTKKVDTVARLLASQSPLRIGSGANGAISVTMVKNPLLVADDWTVLGDGTIAVVREVDYHIDWIAPDGTISSSPKIQHEWERLTDSMKTAIIDSAKRADSVAQMVMRARIDSMSRAAAAGGAPGGGSLEMKAGFEMAMVSGMADGGVISGGAPVVFSPSPNTTMVMKGDVGFGGAQYADLSEMPDYRPPFLPSDSLGFGATKVDAEGNLWIRANLSKPPAGGQVFDIVNRQGKLIDRVQIPGATILMGFGPGVAYLISRDGGGYRLARARIR